MKKIIFVLLLTATYQVFAITATPTIVPLGSGTVSITLSTPGNTLFLTDVSGSPIFSITCGDPSGICPTIGGTSSAVLFPVLTATGTYFAFEQLINDGQAYTLTERRLSPLYVSDVSFEVVSSSTPCVENDDNDEYETNLKTLKWFLGIAKQQLSVEDNLRFSNVKTFLKNHLPKHKVHHKKHDGETEDDCK